jgi:lipoprotein NlpI
MRRLLISAALAAVAGTLLATYLGFLLTPNTAVAFNNRGMVYQDKAQYDRAISDFNQAIGLDPKQAVALDDRGVTNFNSGQFTAAAGDFEHSLSLDAQDVDIVLWLHLARARSDRDDARELASNAAKVDPNTWPGPILAFYLKRIDASDVMRAAGSGDANTQPNQTCQAYFFVGEDTMLRHDTTEAIRLLRQARDTCPPDSLTNAAAAAELKRLEK